MKCCRDLRWIVATAVALLSSPLTQAEDYMTVGLRVAAITAQERLASPSLPTLGSDNEHRFTPQVAYLTGNIYGDFGASEGVIVAGNAHYDGTPKGYGLGMAYRSPSIGRASFFAFGLYTDSSSDYFVTFNSLLTPDLAIRNSKTVAKAGAVGMNILLLGETNSLFALGAFGGGFYSRVHTEYDYDYVSPPAPGYDTHYHHAWDADDYGPLAGLQAIIRIGRFSISSLFMYAYDVSNHCLSLRDAAGNYYPCDNSLDSSFKSVALSADYRGFGIGLYSQLQAKIESHDVQVKKYQASYTISF